jgi:hypothetical protein
LLFEAAQRQGFLKLPVAGMRENVMNFYPKEENGNLAKTLEVL